MCQNSRRAFPPENPVLSHPTLLRQHAVANAKMYAHTYVYVCIHMCMCMQEQACCLAAGACCLKPLESVSTSESLSLLSFFKLSSQYQVPGHHPPPPPTHRCQRPVHPLFPAKPKPCTHTYTHTHIHPRLQRTHRHAGKHTQQSHLRMLAPKS